MGKASEKSSFVEYKDEVKGVLDDPIVKKAIAEAKKAKKDIAVPGKRAIKDTKKLIKALKEAQESENENAVAVAILESLPYDKLILAAVFTYGWKEAYGSRFHATDLLLGVLYAYTIPEGLKGGMVANAWAVAELAVLGAGLLPDGLKNDANLWAFILGGSGGSLLLAAINAANDLGEDIKERIPPGTGGWPPIIKPKPPLVPPPED